MINGFYQDFYLPLPQSTLLYRSSTIVKVSSGKKIDEKENCRKGNLRAIQMDRSTT